MTPRRIDPPAAADATEFQCPKCGGAMVRRVAKRGENAGSEFWGCSMFPKCRTIAPIEDLEQEEAPGADGTDLECPFSSLPPDPPKGLLKKAIAAMDGIWRWNLELDEPDAKDRWKPAHRRKVLNLSAHPRRGAVRVVWGHDEAERSAGRACGAETVRGVRTERRRRSTPRHVLHERAARNGEPPSCAPALQQVQGQHARHSPMEAPEHARAGRSQNQRRSGADAATAGRRVDETDRRGIDPTASRTLTTSPTVSGMLEHIGAGAR